MSATGRREKEAERVEGRKEKDSQVINCYTVTCSMDNQ